MHLFKRAIFILLQKSIKFLRLHKLALFTSIYDNAFWVKHQPKVILLGSSFALTSLIPKQIAKLNSHYKEEEIVNLAQSMGGAYEMYVTLKKNEHLLKEAEYLYLSIDPHILGEKFYHYMSVERMLVSYEQWEYLFKNHKRYMQKYHPSLQWTPFMNLTFLYNIFTKKSPKSSLFGGYQARMHQGIKSYTLESVATYTYEPLELFPPSDFSLYYLQKIAELAKKSDLCIRYMLFPSYDWQVGYESSAKEYDALLVSSLQSYLGDIEIVGTLHKEDIALKEYDFSDNRHLSHSGALKYTTAIFKSMHSQEKKMPIQALYSYHIDNYKRSNEDSFEQNLKLFRDALVSFTEKKEKIILYALTNLSRVVMFALNKKTSRCKICDSSSYLKSAPSFLKDDFIAPKKMIHLSSLDKEEFDAFILCDFLHFKEQLALLKGYNILQKDIFSMDSDFFDEKYFHTQVNMLFSIVDYIKRHFTKSVIVGDSLTLELIEKLLYKSTYREHMSQKEILSGSSFDGDTVFILSGDNRVETHLENCGVDFENIVVVQL